MRPATLRTRRALVAPIAVGGLLLLGACSAGETIDEPEESPAPSSEESTEPSGDGEGEGEDVASGGAACLEGDWVVDTASVIESTLSAPGLAELNPEIEVTGDSTVTFADGTFTTAYANQVTTMTWAMEDQEFSNVSSYDGTLTGVYEATETELTLSDLDTSAVTVGSTTTINGEEIDLGTEGTVQDALSMGGTSTYECSDDELRLTPVVDGVDTGDFVSVLTRK